MAMQCVEKPMLRGDKPMRGSLNCVRKSHRIETRPIAPATALTSQFGAYEARRVERNKLLGGMAERTNATVLKTVEGKLSGGSNPPPSAVCTILRAGEVPESG